jgi:hypothetical protein
LCWDSHYLTYKYINTNTLRTAHWKLFRDRWMWCHAVMFSCMVWYVGTLIGFRRNCCLHIHVRMEVLAPTYQSARRSRCRDDMLWESHILWRSGISSSIVSYQILLLDTSILLKMSFFWGVTPCNLVE